MRKYLAASLMALAMTGVPTAAFAAKPAPLSPSGATGATGVTHPVRPTPTVMYVLRGSLSNYTAATSSAAGSITITVNASNQRKTLTGMTLTFATSPKTIVILHNGTPIANGDRGIVKVRAPRSSDATVLQMQTAFQVIDQGVAK